MKHEEQRKKEFDKGYADAVSNVKKRLSDGEELPFILEDEFAYCPYFPSFFVNDKRHYVVIRTSYGKGYEQALCDIEDKKTEANE